MKVMGVIKNISWEEATKCMSDECKYLASKPHNIKRWEKFRGRQISINFRSPAGILTKISRNKDDRSGSHDGNI